MFGILISMMLLGLSAIDPVGIATMPILLTQEKPYRRSLTFLGGSFIALVGMGLLFARGFGAIVLRFDDTHAWMVPIAEAVAGLILLSIAGVLLIQIKQGKTSVEPSKSLAGRLQMGTLRLGFLGAGLVIVQSVIDVVFVIAMIHLGRLQLPAPELTAAVMTYAVAALALQAAVVVAYRLAPPRHRAKTLAGVHKLLTQYANQAMAGISLALGCMLLLLAAY